MDLAPLPFSIGEAERLRDFFSPDGSLDRLRESRSDFTLDLERDLDLRSAEPDRDLRERDRDFDLLEPDLDRRDLLADFERDFLPDLERE